MDAQQWMIGTSGWSYPSGFGKWTGVFYPKRWKGDELAYYAERFPAVEVNSTFYRLPAEETARSWVERTPPGFLFAIKLYRKFTHPDFYAREEGLSPEITPEDIRAVRRSLDALAEQEQLGALLVQYADHLHRTPESVARVTGTLETFHDYPLAVEFRHPSWQTPATRELLAAHQAAFVRIDEPFFNNLHEPNAPPARVEYWRFHGRNTAQWKVRGAGNARYDYLYSPEELSEMAEQMLQESTHSGRHLAFFNNHPNGKAATNAVEMAAALGIELPFQKFANLTEHFPRLAPLVGRAEGVLDFGF